MAVTTTEHSAIIDAIAATPPTLVSPGVYGGNVKVQIARVSIADNDDVGSIYRMFRVKSTDTVLSIKYFTPDTLTAMAADVGLYRTQADGGAVVDADAYASAASFATANVLAGVELAFEARGVGVLGQPVWDDIAGQSTDTRTSYDIAVTITTQVTDPGTLTMVLLYVENN